MSNDKHYPLHPNATHPPIMTCEIPLEEYESLKRENAELKAENERLNNSLDKERSETIKYMDELCNAKNEIERLTIDKRNAELRADVADATVAELKAKLESVQATAYAESVDAGMRERRLKRALYKACSNWARSERYTEATWHGDEHREELWAKVEVKCLKKAEEYK